MEMSKRDVPARARSDEADLLFDIIVLGGGSAGGPNAQGVLRNKEDPEDALQECWLKGGH